MPCAMHWKFQSTHSLRSATKLVTQQESRIKVSIHALLAECDFAFAIMGAR